MAQHDYVIANQSGASFRADLNNALAAIVSNNSGATAPSTTYAYQWWADTTAGQLKLRNAANSAWITIQELDGTMLMEDGTAASPGLAFASDLDTGFFRAGTNQLGIATNGTGRLFVDASGNVGIGTASPGYALDVVQASDAQMRLRTSGTTSSDDTLLRFSVNNTGGSNYIYFGDSGNSSIGIIRYNHSTDALSFDVNASERLRIDSSGRVGIGTPSPVEKLTVDGSICARNTSDDSQIKLSHNGTIASISATYGSTGAYDPLAFFTSDTERARIDSSGRLLVGTSSSVLNGSTVAGKLQIADTASAAVVSVATWVNNANGSILALGKSRSATPGSYAIVSDNDLIGAVRFAADDGTDLDTRAAEIKAEVDGTPGANDMPGRIVLATTADGASSPSERMRIRSDGRIGINDNGSAAEQVHINGASGVQTALYAEGNGSGNGYGVHGKVFTGNSAQYGVYGEAETSSSYASGGLLGYSINDNTYGIVGYWSTAAYWSFYGNGPCGATAFTNVSDSRLKDVHSDLTGCLDKLANIQPVKYTWKENSQQRRSVGDRLEIGLLAEEVQSQFPELVSEMEWGKVTGANPETLNEQLGTTLGVDYGRMTAVLIQALNEAKTRIETLEAKVAAFENA